MRGHDTCIIRKLCEVNEMATVPWVDQYQYSAFHFSGIYINNPSPLRRKSLIYHVIPHNE